jgi:3'-phosphoadenosine 5'-phosphosulfate sulfotransferase (PAPS reductase)/FAD synthetase
MERRVKISLRRTANFHFLIKAIAALNIQVFVALARDTGLYFRNLYRVARDIAEHIEGNLIARPTVDNQETIRVENKIIGIVFSVYLWECPSL